MNKKFLMSLAIFSSSFVIGELTDASEAQANTDKKGTTAQALTLKSYTLTADAKTYVTADNASAKANAKNIYKKGTYYIYKTASNGMINVSRTPGKPGAWINPNGNLVEAPVNAPATKPTAQNVAKAPAPTPVTKPSTETKAPAPVKNGEYVLNSNVNTYVSSANAAAGTSAKSIYQTGTYYIYKIANNGMINISRTPGRAGAWINPSQNVGVAKVETKVEKAATPAKVETNKQVPAQTPAKAPVTPAQTPTVPSSLEGKVFPVYNDVKAYVSAANAAARTNARSTYKKGTYYIYKTASNGMINVSRTPGKPGAWINTNDLPSGLGSAPAETKVEPVKEKVATKTQETPKKVVVQDKGSNEGVRTNYGKYSKVIYLDAGHGGTDPGAVYNGLKEKDLTLSIYNKLSSQLKKQGYTIMSTRANDSYTGLQQISEKANASNADIFLSIHFNASKNPSVDGIETYWYQDFKEYPTKINKDNHLNPDRLRRSQILANGIQSNLISNTGATNRGVRRDTFSVLRETAIPAVLLELGFVSNKNEASKLGKSSYQDKLVDGIVKGINNYYEKA